MKKMRKRIVSTLLAAALLATAFCVPALAEQRATDYFIETAKVGSTKIVKDGSVYDMYDYLGGRAVLEQEEDGTVVMPMRIVSEMAGLDVLWEEDAWRVTLTDPASGEYWVFTIQGETAVKYDAAGKKLGSHTFSWRPQLRYGATYLSVDDMRGMYGYQIHKRVYNDGTYVVISNKALTITESELFALCEFAADNL